MNTTLTAALIVKDEAANLEDCLASVAGWVDRILVMDAGSTDSTLAIAKRYQADIQVNADWPGFGKQRQLAQHHIPAGWVLWLDADERVTPELRDEIRAVLQQPPECTVFALPRLSWAFGRFIRHSGWYPGHVIRLYPVNLTGYDDAQVHEKVVVPAGVAIARLRADLLHYTYRDIGQYLGKMAHYTQLWAQQRQACGKQASLGQAVGHAVACFSRMYLLRAGFLDGKQGFILAVISAYATFAKYADLWIRQHNRESYDHTA